MSMITPAQLHALADQLEAAKAFLLDYTEVGLIIDADITRKVALYMEASKVAKAAFVGPFGQLGIKDWKKDTEVTIGKGTRIYGTFPPTLATGRDSSGTLFRELRRDTKVKALNVFSGSVERGIDGHPGVVGGIRVINPQLHYKEAGCIHYVDVNKIAEAVTSACPLWPCSAKACDRHSTLVLQPPHTLIG
jgi:hypothetical protein